MKDVERIGVIPPAFPRDNDQSELSENETQDIVSMNNYKNNLAALSARQERGEYIMAKRNADKKVANATVDNKKEKG